MKPVYAAVSDVVAAPPERVYALLADYRAGHPHILPPAYFRGLDVEQGGRGAGTVVRVRMRAFGAEHVYRMVVREPEPGRVLVEEDEDAGVTTTFTVTPLDEGRRSRVEIATRWAASSGLAGVVERLSNPPVARMIYKKELRLLAAYLQGASADAAATT